MREYFTYIDGKPTHFLCSDNATEIQKKIVGKKVSHDGRPTESDQEDLPYVVIIPGNPGCITYYWAFCEELEKQLEGKVHIVAVDHAGHDIPATWYDAFKGAWNPYGLEDQILHKQVFLKEFLPKNASIIFVGHSIGSYVILELMKRMGVALHVQKAYLLFSTVERMHDTPNGKKLGVTFHYFRWLLVFLAFLFTLLPSSFQSFCIRKYFSKKKISPWSLTATERIARPSAVSNIVFMADTELQCVRELDRDTVMKHKTRLLFYYGARDPWCPKRFYYDMKMSIPGVQAQLCNKGFPHAFVLKHSERVAEMCASWIKDFLMPRQDKLTQAESMAETVKKIEESL